jgi:hypothetical protein
MKKVLFFLFSAPLFVAAQTPANSFTIEGKLDGFADGTKISLYKNGVQTEWAATKLEKGKFTLKEKVNEPVLSFIVIENVPNAVEVYVENAVITVKGNKSQPGKYEISGSRSHKDFTEFIADFMPLAQQLNATASSINATMPGGGRDSLMNSYTGQRVGSR